MRCWSTGLSVIPTPSYRRLSRPSIRCVRWFRWHATMRRCSLREEHRPKHKHVIGADPRGAAVPCDALLRPRAGEGNTLPRLLRLQRQETELEGGGADC